MSTLAITTFLFSVAIANGLIYLCHQRQSWLDKPLPRLPWMVCGFFIHLNAFFTAHTYLGLLQACIIYLTVCALCFGLILFLSLVMNKLVFCARSR